MGDRNEPATHRPLATPPNGDHDDRADLVDHAVLDHLGGDADGVADRRRPGRAVGDDAHAVDSEQDGAAVGVGVERVVQRDERRQQGVGVLLVAVLGEGRRGARAISAFKPPSSVFSVDVAGEPVGDGDVDVVAHHVAALDVADEVDRPAPPPAAGRPPCAASRPCPAPRRSTAARPAARRCWKRVRA